MAINWNRYKTYDTSSGYGNASKWKETFYRRMSGEEAISVLKQQSDTPHAILGVGVGATKQEIKKAFREKMMQWHPDRNVDNTEQATEMSKRIIAAYTVLTS